jgi:signal peptidase I
VALSEDDDEKSEAAHRDGDRADVMDDPGIEETAEEESGRQDDKPAKPVRKGSLWKELPILIVVALVLTFLIQTFIARVYVIPSGSMEQTLHGCTGCTGDRILVDKLTFDFTDPRPGDVIVFKGPTGWDQAEFNVDEPSNVVVKWLRQFGSSIGIGTPPEYDLVKRIIAVGGQTVQCCNAQHQLLVDGKALTEPYVYVLPGTEIAAYQPFGPITIPKGDLWMEGDSRGNSDDSRIQNGGGLRGVVPVSDVIGVARTIIWPPSRWRGIGETNAQTTAIASAPAWERGAPSGVGFAAAFPMLWLGKRTRRGLRAGYTLARDRVRR